MNILAVDTAGKTAGVALLQDDRLLYEVYLDAGMTHSETLMPMIDTCLKMCGMTCADIDLYGVNAGPGSFTGLRIGLAAVKGLAFPRETLCAPVSTLEALAAAHTGEAPYCAHWMPAVRRYTVPRSTLPPTAACWKTMPGRWQIWPIL